MMFILIWMLLSLTTVSNYAILIKVITHIIFFTAVEHAFLYRRLFWANQIFLFYSNILIILVILFDLFWFCHWTPPRYFSRHSTYSQWTAKLTKVHTRNNLWWLKDTVNSLSITAVESFLVIPKSMFDFCYFSFSAIFDTKNHNLPFDNVRVRVRVQVLACVCMYLFSILIWLNEPQANNRHISQIIFRIEN